MKKLLVFALILTCSATFAQKKFLSDPKEFKKSFGILEDTSVTIINMITPEDQKNWQRYSAFISDIKAGSYKPMDTCFTVMNNIVYRVIRHSFERSNGKLMLEILTDKLDADNTWFFESVTVGPLPEQHYIRLSN